MVKKKPVGTRKSSMSGEPEIQNQSQSADRDRERHGPLVPAYAFVVLELR